MSRLPMKYFRNSTVRAIIKKKRYHRDGNLRPLYSEASNTLKKMVRERLTSLPMPSSMTIRAKIQRLVGVILFGYNNEFINTDCISVVQTRSANFACKINDFSLHYVHSARFSCRMCLLFNILRRTGISSCHNFVSVKRKTDEFLRCKFRFKFRCSYIY